MERSVYQRMAMLEKQHWWFTARSAILSRLLETVPLPEGARILEVGSGTGGNLSWLQRFGKVTALEPDSTARTLCREHYGITPLAGALPDHNPLAGEQFDLVAALDVIEHIAEDAGALVAIRQLLKPGGHLLLTVPAWPWLWSEHDRTHHHRRRYRRTALIRLLEQSGFQIRYASYYNSLLFPLVAGARLLKAILPGRRAPDDQMPPPALNRLLGRLFASERHWLGRRRRLPVGVSLVVIAQAPTAPPAPDRQPAYQPGRRR